MSQIPKLPPLGPLRAFHAVAKYESIIQATDELNVSASAVSQSIKKLEQWYGLPLLKRERKRVYLSPEGIVLRDTCDRIFELLAVTSQQILNEADVRTVTLSILPSFVPLRMNALLGPLTEQFPDISIKLSSTISLTDFRYDDIDIAIRYGVNPTGKYHHTEWLSDDELQPYIGPELLGDSDPDDLSLLTQHRLIRDLSTSLSTPELWHCWLSANQLTNADINDANNLTTDNYFHAAELAAANQGIVMGRRYLLGDWVRSGKLVPLFPSLPTAVSPAAYYLLHKTDDRLTRQSRNVKDFLIQQLRAEPTETTPDAAIVPAEREVEVEA